MPPLLSIIIFASEGESYLKACLDSILKQKFNDYELVLVNQNTPDNCVKICKEYACKDNRITVIRKKIEGISSARNAGLDVARGKYITFVDAYAVVAGNPARKIK